MSGVRSVSNSEISEPAQKVSSPAPRTTITFTPDAIKESTADGTLLYIDRFIALRSLGFEMVKVPMSFVVEVRMSPAGSLVITPRN